jgi:hypothetical protein
MQGNYLPSKAGLAAMLLVAIAAPQSLAAKVAGKGMGLDRLITHHHVTQQDAILVGVAILGVLIGRLGFSRTVKRPSGQ